MYRLTEKAALAAGVAIHFLILPYYFHLFIEIEHVEHLHSNACKHSHLTLFLPLRLLPLKHDGGSQGGACSDPFKREPAMSSVICPQSPVLNLRDLLSIHAWTAPSLALLS